MFCCPYLLVSNCFLCEPVYSPISHDCFWNCLSQEPCFSISLRPLSWWLTAAPFNECLGKHGGLEWRSSHVLRLSQTFEGKGPNSSGKDLSSESGANAEWEGTEVHSALPVVALPPEGGYTWRVGEWGTNPTAPGFDPIAASGPFPWMGFPGHQFLTCTPGPVFSSLAARAEGVGSAVHLRSRAPLLEMTGLFTVKTRPCFWSRRQPMLHCGKLGQHLHKAWYNL